MPDEEFNKLIKSIQDGMNDFKEIFEDTCNNLKESIEENNNQGKVRFEFKESDPEVKLIIGRNKMWQALYELNNYKRQLAKYPHNEIIVNENRVLSDEDLRNQESIDGNKAYVEIQDVIDKIDYILQDVYSLIDKY